jgi:hypothetical protein
MGNINIASMHCAREFLAELPEDHIPKRRTIRYRGEEIDLTVRRCGKKGALTGGIVIQARPVKVQTTYLYTGRIRRLPPGHTPEALTKACARCIAEAKADGVHKRSQAEFEEWFDSQEVPQQILDDWVSGETGISQDGVITCFSEMTPADMDYWRNKIESLKLYAQKSSPPQSNHITDTHQ